MPAQVSKKRTKNGQQPAKSAAVSVSKKNGRRVLKSVAKEVAGYRPDLKVRVAGGAERVCCCGVWPQQVCGGVGMGTCAAGGRGFTSTYGKQVVMWVGLVLWRVWLFWWGRVVAVGASTGHVWVPDNARTVGRGCRQQQADSAV
jgi:hypothetical protein